MSRNVDRLKKEAQLLSKLTHIETTMKRNMPEPVRIMVNLAFVDDNRPFEDEDGDNDKTDDNPGGSREDRTDDHKDDSRLTSTHDDREASITKQAETNSQPPSKSRNSNDTSSNNKRKNDDTPHGTDAASEEGTISLPKMIKQTKRLVFKVNELKDDLPDDHEHRRIAIGLVHKTQVLLKKLYASRCCPADRLTPLLDEYNTYRRAYYYLRDMVAGWVTIVGQGSRSRILYREQSGRARSADEDRCAARLRAQPPNCSQPYAVRCRSGNRDAGGCRTGNRDAGGGRRPVCHADDEGKANACKCDCGQTARKNDMSWRSYILKNCCCCLYPLKCSMNSMSLI